MPNISLTDFTDFVLCTGQSRITKVSEIFRRGEYHPAHDFWKLLREQICDFHAGKAPEISFSSTGAHSSKADRYEAAIKGYTKFLGLHKPVWFRPHKAQWEFEDLTIRVNPEVGFHIGTDSMLVKLYFKQEPLTRHRVQVALGVMKAAQKNPSFRVAIIDVPRARIYRQTSSTPSMHALLEGEAATFLGIWKSLTEEESLAA